MHQELQLFYFHLELEFLAVEINVLYIYHTIMYSYAHRLKLQCVYDRRKCIYIITICSDIKGKYNKIEIV